MSRSDAERLDDIRAAIARCIAYRDHLDSAELGSMAYDAVLRNLAVVGEAVRSLPDGFKEEHANTPWASIAGLRNVVVHRVNHQDSATHPAPAANNHSGGDGGTLGRVAYAVPDFRSWFLPAGVLASVGTVCCPVAAVAG